MKYEFFNVQTTKKFSGDCQAGSQEQADDGAGGDSSGCDAESRLDPLHAARARASHSPVQKTHHQCQTSGCLTETI